MNGDGLGEEVVASDLFFSLSALLIVLLCLMSQSLRAVVADPAPNESALSQAAVQSGRWLILARGDGATLIGADGSVRDVGMPDLLSDQTATWAQGAAGPVWQIILPDARDSAFLLDTVLARAGLEAITRVRLDQPCPRPRILPTGLVCDG